MSSYDYLYKQALKLQKHGTEKEFENLVRQNELLIYKVCRIYAYTNADQKDLFQEIVIQLWKAYPRFKGESKFSTWLYRVAINTTISIIRRERHFIKSYEPSALPTGSTEENYNEAAEEQMKQLYVAIEQLNTMEKAIVMLYMEDRSYEEMEDILGISQGNLRVKMSRVKDKLRQLTKK